MVSACTYRTHVSLPCFLIESQTKMGTFCKNTKGFMTVVICVIDECLTVVFKLTVSRATVGTQETRVSGKYKGRGAKGASGLSRPPPPTLPPPPGGVQPCGVVTACGSWRRLCLPLPNVVPTVSYSLSLPWASCPADGTVGAPGGVCAPAQCLSPALLTCGLLTLQRAVLGTARHFAASLVSIVAGIRQPQ